MVINHNIYGGYKSTAVRITTLHFLTYIKTFLPHIVHSKIVPLNDMQKPFTNG